ncbi:hypothetical protein L9F63_005310, partial [Diploptera punctata]
AIGSLRNVCINLTFRVLNSLVDSIKFLFSVYTENMIEVFKLLIFLKNLDNDTEITMICQIFSYSLSPGLKRGCLHYYVGIGSCKCSLCAVWMSKSLYTNCRHVLIILSMCIVNIPHLKKLVYGILEALQAALWVCCDNSRSRVLRALSRYVNFRPLLAKTVSLNDRITKRKRRVLKLEIGVSLSSTHRATKIEMSFRILSFRNLAASLVNIIAMRPVRKDFFIQISEENIHSSSLLACSWIILINVKGYRERKSLLPIMASNFYTNVFLSVKIYTSDYMGCGARQTVGQSMLILNDILYRNISIMDVFIENVHLLREKLELCNKDGAHATVVHLSPFGGRLFMLKSPYSMIEGLLAQWPIHMLTAMHFTLI